MRSAHFSVRCFSLMLLDVFYRASSMSLVNQKISLPLPPSSLPPSPPLTSLTSFSPSLLSPFSPPSRMHYFSTDHKRTLFNRPFFVSFFHLFDVFVILLLFFWTSCDNLAHILLRVHSAVWRNDWSTAQHSRARPTCTTEKLGHKHILQRYHEMEDFLHLTYSSHKHRL